jgi:hypothetical protein
MGKYGSLCILFSGPTFSGALFLNDSYKMGLHVSRLEQNRDRTFLSENTISLWSPEVTSSHFGHGHMFMMNLEL